LATATEIDAAAEAKAAPRRAPGGSKRRSPGRSDGVAVSRFFLGTADGGAPALEREVESEKEAMLESLKTGKNYFAVSEWKAVPDLSKRTPQIRSEPVARETRASGPAPRGSRSPAPAQVS
jgi:hypothetical protein